MKNITKFSVVALLSVLLMGCDQLSSIGASTNATSEQVAVDAKTEFQQLISLDNEFNPALDAVQQKIVLANKNQDKEALQSASNEFFSVMKDAIQKYKGMSIQDTAVKSLRDKMVTVLEQTIDFTKSAQQAKTDEAKKAAMEKRESLIVNAQGLQKRQNDLAVKFGLTQNTPAPQNAEEAAK
ncbi:hypothetical protein QJU89_00545 [Pasteurella skyensis]|uniref:Lipoprotein n=1 Tax=Phocoenobacter skyensis TaxID=97481 RepID=A0AAJ6N842_9PAST|nr:hypothetical protein [Pasteurella skyensis]MDP8161785.1 hypothetical protein [Pasteurella skyensis]MDP8171941.1 hypothetical protein [Pasteurella skyensis]MDP8176176.1 hypothetical protein [Pasteurella skyensis]MDP8178196.1 hypothetical protein [Pasteurella skyensis]MDP8182196.1 hypothetical protein [Pasteurella skyensis]